jgi:hypothetical protein
MNQRTPLVLAIILLALLAGSYYASTQTQSNAPAPSSGPWLQLDKITNVSIVDMTSGRQFAASQNAMGGWTASGAVDSLKLESWLDQWQYIYVQHTITPTGSLAEYGLTPPTLVITFTAQAGGQTVVYVGNRAIAVSGYYARQAGRETVAVIDVGAVDETRSMLNTPLPAPTSGLTVTVGTATP